MKINLKILFPIFVLLTIIIVSFSYLIFYLDSQTKIIAKQIENFKLLNELTNNLLKEQESTEFAMISYLFSKDSNFLEELKISDINKDRTVNELLAVANDEITKKSIEGYASSRENIYLLRSELLKAVQNGKQSDINTKYLIWNSRTQEIRNSLKTINTSNTTALEKTLGDLNRTEEHLAIVIVGLILLVILIIFLFFFYLRKTITSPIIKLCKYAEDVAKKNFTSIIDSSLVRNDEIGQFYKTLIAMAKTVENSYKTLEKTVRDRTSDLTKRTEELEKSQEEKEKLISDLNRERKDLIATKTLDAAILSSMGEAVVVIDTDGIITYCNEAFENITGWKTEEAIGKKFTDIVPSQTEKGENVEDKDRFVSKILDGQNPENDYKNTIFYVRKDGSRFPVNSLVKRIKLQGKMIGAVKTFSDITRIKDIDKAKTEFVSLAAHQLRTPLSAIGWYSEMLLSGDAGDITEDQKKYLTQIYEANQRMVGMVKSFLNASRIEMSSLANNELPTDLCDILESTAQEQMQKIKQKKIHFELNCEPNLPHVTLDPEKIRMVFQNLLSNAIKYTPEEGSVAIVASLDADRKNYLIEFKDTGMGIPKNDQDKIFSKLFRATNATEKATDGTGLGLYVAKTIVDNYHGKIWFHSEEHKGTTFFLSLPL